VKQYALKYSCGHYYCGCHGESIPLAFEDYLRRHRWQIKEILTPCRECSPKVKRLPPGLAESVAEQEW